VQTFRTTEDLFQRPLHEYTITHAIEDGNVLRFHIDYYKPKGTDAPKAGQTLQKRAVTEAILDKHAAATGGRKFNALLATASINDAIEYFELFTTLQGERQAGDPDFIPLNVAAVFSPPGDVSADVRQIQEDLIQEKEDNKHDPEQKKTALKAIVADYNARFGTNHRIEEFDLYYQDVQKRIKDQQYPNADLPRKGAEKIDVTIVVDMLLTGFDSKYFNTLYVDKNLKSHGLIQAFSRTNRVLNASKPYGHILDFRGQQAEVDAAIALFSGASAEKAREIWLVDAAPMVIDQLESAVVGLQTFLKSQGLEGKPQDVPHLKGDAARAGFLTKFKEVQRLQTQLDQYTDLTPEHKQAIETILPKDDHKAFKGVYLETAQRLRDQRNKTGDGKTPDPAVDQLEFEFVLFASATIDYDYIVSLIAKFSEQKPGKQSMSRDELIGLIAADAKFIDEREAITEYVRSLATGKPLTDAAVRDGYQQFKAEKDAAELAALATTHGLPIEPLQAFIDAILRRMIFDGEQLTVLMEPLELGWRDRLKRELALMSDLLPLLNRRAAGREISGLQAYEGEAGR
jgi:type I restriction enzyme R subunit